MLDRFFEFVFLRGLGALQEGWVLGLTEGYSGTRGRRAREGLCRCSPGVVVVRSVCVLLLEPRRWVVLQVESLDVGGLGRLAKCARDLIVLMLHTPTVPWHEAMLP